MNEFSFDIHVRVARACSLVILKGLQKNVCESKSQKTVMDIQRGKNGKYNIP